jgi:hypothetical protein
VILGRRADSLGSGADSLTESAHLRGFSVAEAHACEGGFRPGLLVSVRFMGLVGVSVHVISLWYVQVMN